MDTKILEQIGLAKNEIKVYFALLELEESSATPIVKKSGIPNSKVYPTLEKLISKGLVSYIIKNNVRVFRITDPKNLIEFLEKKENQIVLQKEEIKKIIPQIKAKRKFADKQESAIYEGIKGIAAAFNDIIRSLPSGKEYQVFTLGDELATDELKSFFREFHKKRILKNIKVRLISSPQLKSTFAKHHKYKNMKIKYINLNLPTGIFIYENKVMTLVWGKTPTAFVITSSENSKKYKNFFEEIWGKAKT